MQMECSNDFREGTRVEVCKNDFDFEWYEGVILSKRYEMGGNCRYVIQILDGNVCKEDLEVLLGLFSAQEVRPVPLKMKLHCGGVGDGVEVRDFSKNCWRRGFISQVLPNNSNHFLIYYPGTKQFWPHHRCNLRPAMSWCSGTWSYVRNESFLNQHIHPITASNRGEPQSSVGSSPSLSDLETDAQTNGDFKEGRNGKATFSNSKSVKSHGKRLGSIKESKIDNQTECKKKKSSNNLRNAAKRMKQMNTEDLEQQDLKHSRELQRYCHILKSYFFASKTLTWEQLDALTKLRIELHVTNDKHLHELRKLRKL